MQYQNNTGQQPAGTQYMVNNEINDERPTTNDVVAGGGGTTPVVSGRPVHMDPVIYGGSGGHINPHNTMYGGGGYNNMYGVGGGQQVQNMYQQQPGR